MYVNTEIADKYQEFFNFMSQEHDLTLTISEMDEIVIEAQKLVEKLAKPLVRLSLPDNLEEEILKSKRFRKCDWIDVDGINYLRMMPETEIVKMVRDIVKKSNEA